MNETHSIGKGSRVTLDSPYGHMTVSGGKKEPHGYERMPNGTLGEVLRVGNGGVSVAFSEWGVFTVPTHWLAPEAAHA